MWLPINNNRHEAGFTLIELVVVITIMGLIIGITVPSLITYSDLQRLQTATLGVVTTLEEAKSQSESQVKPASCSSAQTLNGYQVDILSVTTYQLGDICSGTYVGETIQTLPLNIVFTFTTYPQTFFFTTQHNGVSSSVNTITLQNQVNTTNTITVDQLGNIHYTTN